MRNLTRLCAGAIWATALAAGGFGCAESSQPSPQGFQIQVAPLSLPGIDDACYTIEVHNDLDQLVWTEQHICASQYGNQIGDITYIGTCDAQDQDSTDSGTALNTVTLTIENLYTATVNHGDYSANAVADGEWRNPCAKTFDGTPVDPDGDATAGPNADGYGPCQLVRPCVENQDTRITFNVSIMRDANQGFFDIAVNFDDVFCSAKVDCTYDDAGTKPITLLHDTTTTGSPRSQTAVVALACTDGAADVDNTWIYLNDVAVNCYDDAGGLVTADSAAVAPSDGPGNITTTDGVLFGAAVYEGNEELDCGASAAAGDCHKNYWNVALGLDLAKLEAATANGHACFIETSATAAGEDLGLMTPVDTVYPYIEVKVPVGASGGVVTECTRHPLDGATPHDGVATQYTTFDQPKGFLYYQRPDATTEPSRITRCTHLLALDPTLTDGYYTLDVDGDPATANPSVYCDMAEGGWMRIDKIEGDVASSVATLGYFGDTSGIGTTFYTDPIRGMGWGDAPDNDYGNPKFEDMHCYGPDKLGPVDFLRVIPRAAPPAGALYGYLHIYQEEVHTQDEINTLGFDNVAWGQFIDAWRFETTDKAMVYAPYELLVDKNSPVMRGETIDGGEVVMERPVTGEHLLFCMGGEDPAGDAVPSTYDKRFLKEVWIK